MSPSNRKSAKNKKQYDSSKPPDSFELTVKEMEASINGLRVALNMQVTLVHDLSKNLLMLKTYYSHLKQ